MAEHVMENVRLLDIGELLGRPDPVAGRKAPGREVSEEDGVRHEPGDRDDGPPGCPRQHAVHLGEIWDSSVRDAERLEAGIVFGNYAPLEEFGLTVEQGAPSRVILRGVAVGLLGNQEIGRNYASAARVKARDGVHGILPANRGSLLGL